MVVILVDWKIKEDRAEEFENFSKTLGNVEGKKGFYCEILTKPVAQSDSKFNTLGMTDRNYCAYMNLGFWNSVEDFERAVIWLEPYHRPILCTEFMARPQGSTFDTILPLAKKHRITAPWCDFLGPVISCIPFLSRNRSQG